MDQKPLAVRVWEVKDLLSFIKVCIVLENYFLDSKKNHRSLPLLFLFFEIIDLLIPALNGGQRLH